LTTDPPTDLWIWIWMSSRQGPWQGHHTDEKFERLRLRNGSPDPLYVWF